MTRSAKAKTPAQAPTVVAPVGMPADALTEAAFATWKQTHQAKARAEFANELARSHVAQLFKQYGVQFFLSSLGTIALQMRGGIPSVNWQAIARAGISPKKLERLIAQHTTVTDVTPTVAAPAGWTAELGLKSAG